MSPALRHEWPQGFINTVVRAQMQRTLRVQETDLQPNPDFHHQARIYYMLVLRKDRFFRDFELIKYRIAYVEFLTFAFGQKEENFGHEYQEINWSASIEIHVEHVERRGIFFRAIKRTAAEDRASARKVRNQVKRGSKSLKSLLSRDKTVARDALVRLPWNNNDSQVSSLSR